MPMQVDWPTPLPDRLVGEGAAAGDNADRARFVDVAGHDADLALAGGDYARAVGADQSGILTLHVLLHLDHVQDRDPFGDAADHADAGVHRLHDGVGGEWGRDEDDRGVGAGIPNCFPHRVEDRKALDLGPSLAGGNTTDHLRAIFTRSPGVEQPGCARYPLGDYSCILIDENAHFYIPFRRKPLSRSSPHRRPCRRQRLCPGRWRPVSLSPSPRWSLPGGRSAAPAGRPAGPPRRCRWR